ncbi:MAG: bifunctional UDP-sugar hydrolase/5'-nucleotidase [Candidatus Wallbacteria bacterium]
MTKNGFARKKIFSFLFIYFILSVTFVFSTAVNAAPEDGRKKITILHTNDNHSHLMPFDVKEISKNIGGMARRAKYIDSVRSENKNVLLFDAGDLFQGTAFYTIFHGEPDILSYSLCGYDAVTMGNHDIDNGLDNLLLQLSKGNFPMLCSNIFYSDSKKPVFPAFKIFNVSGMKIAVLGCIGTKAWGVIPKKLVTQTFIVDETQMISRLSKMLKKYVDLVIVISHCGYRADIELAKNVNTVDLIIGGHTNTKLDKPELIKNGANNGIGGTLIVQAFRWGVFVGKIDVTLCDGKIIEYSGNLDTMESKIKIGKSSQINKLIKSYEKKLKKFTSEQVGTNSADMLYPENEKHLKDLPLGSFVCDAMKEYTNADISIINSGAVRDSLLAGPVTISKIYDIVPFDNSVVCYDMNGLAINEMLDYIAANYSKITGYQYGGVTFKVDTKLKKAVDIKIGGNPIAHDKIYKMATISYLAEGNQNGDILFKKASNLTDTGFFMRDAVLEYVKNHKDIIPPVSGRLQVIN